MKAWNYNSDLERKSHHNKRCWDKYYSHGKIKISALQYSENIMQMNQIEK